MPADPDAQNQDSISSLGCKISKLITNKYLQTIRTEVFAHPSIDFFDATCNIRAQSGQHVNIYHQCIRHVSYVLIPVQGHCQVVNRQRLHRHRWTFLWARWEAPVSPSRPAQPTDRGTKLAVAGVAASNYKKQIRTRPAKKRPCGRSGVPTTLYSLTKKMLYKL